jgi:HAD superfamily hydrolase (TIGR01484 family)
MKPIEEMTEEEARGIRFVLMDIDDTLTQDGKLLPHAFEALWRLHDAGLKVIPITGRPAGWCDLIAREWPVDGVVGENGALAFWEIRSKGRRPCLRRDFHPNAVKNDHPVLTKIKNKALEAVPGLRVAGDQFSRLFDLALDFAEEEPVLPLEEAEKVKAIALQEKAQAKISSIHVNVWMGKYDKLSMAERFLARRFDWNVETGRREALFAGDSPNDEPMFANFPLACAVANIRNYGACIKTLPAFSAHLSYGEGFAEIAETILSRRRPGGRRHP